jgi:hypothetical protein
LVDFGSVQTLAATEGGTITVVGTYGYMPPEQFGGRTVPASDLYSLGATLIALVTGTHPADLPQKDGQIQFEQAANLSPAFADWLRWMTQPSLDKRLTSAVEALQALEQPPQRDIAPIVVNKPTGSKVSVTKEAHSLEILIPAKGLYSDAGLRFFIALLYSFFIGPGLLLSIFNVHFPYYSPGWLQVRLILELITALLIVSVMVALMATISFLCFAFIRVRLRINQQKFFLTYELFDWSGNKHRNVEGLRQAIAHLEYTQRPSTKGRQGKLKPRIIVWIGGTQSFRLGDDGGITEPELDWLAYELSDWLELPITRE